MQRTSSLSWLLVALSFGAVLGPLGACSGPAFRDDSRAATGGTGGSMPDFHEDEDYDLPDYCAHTPPLICSGDVRVVTGVHYSQGVLPQLAAPGFGGAGGQGGGGGQGGDDGDNVIVRLYDCWDTATWIHVSPGQKVTVITGTPDCDTNSEPQTAVADAAGWLDVPAAALLIIPAAEFECLSVGDRYVRCADALDPTLR